MKPEPPSTIDDIIEIWNQKGDSEYGGEAVTQLEHALQAAYLAEQEDAHPELITAALLHDFGHLVHDLPDDAPDQGIDDCHENIGKNYLKSFFPQSVIEPIQLHVDAKRYLCAVEPGYLEKLSEPSVTSLHLQGGPMNDNEIQDFESNRYWRDAVRLRKWDDEAKIPDLKVPGLEHYRNTMLQAQSNGKIA